MNAPHQPRTRRILASLVLALAAGPGAAQSLPTVSQIEAERLVGDGGARANDYFDLFADLTATETKTVEELRGDGGVSQRRLIVSDLIVYRSQVDRGSVSEYRDVRTVDGAPVAEREQRVLALFERGGRAGSARDELTRVNREGSRYDLDHTVAGLTVGQALPLQASARAFFDFTFAGEDRIGGRRVVLLDYVQAVPNPRFGFDLSLPSELRRTAPLYRGRLWLDADTSQIWREVRDVTVRPSAGGAPVLVQRTEFDYVASKFDVPLPQRIVFTAFLRFSKSGDVLVSSPLYRVTFAYGEFRRFTTESDEGEIARVAPSDTPSEAPAAAVDVAAPDASSLGPEFGPDAPLGPPEPARPAVAAQPRGASTAPAASHDVSAHGDLPPSLHPPAFPVVSITPPPPPPAPGPRFRVPPS